MWRRLEENFEVRGFVGSGGGGGGGGVASNMLGGPAVKLGFGGGFGFGARRLRRGFEERKPGFCFRVEGRGGLDGGR